jgi:hypothetical protein
MNSQSDFQDADPIASAASQLTDAQAKSLIETILVLYGRVAALVANS